MLCREEALNGHDEIIFGVIFPLFQSSWLKQNQINAIYDKTKLNSNQLKNLILADRATIANMAPEYGATCGFFPIDDETLNYLKFSGRDALTVKIVEEYAKAQGLWASNDIEFTDSLSLDMTTIVPTISGPKRPQDKVLLTDASVNFKKSFSEITIIRDWQFGDQDI